MAFGDSGRRIFVPGPPAGPPVIADPQPARGGAMPCRRGRSRGRTEVQGQPVPTCEGTVEFRPPEQEKDGLLLGQCSKCGLAHGAAAGAKGIVYGALV